MHLSNSKWALPVRLKLIWLFCRHYIRDEMKWLLMAFCLTCTLDQVTGSIVLRTFADGSIPTRLLRFWQAYDWPIMLALLLFTARQVRRYINNRKLVATAKVGEG
jgi:hypothetical protein